MRPLYLFALGFVILAATAWGADVAPPDRSPDAAALAEFDQLARPLNNVGIPPAGGYPSEIKQAADKLAAWFEKLALGPDYERITVTLMFRLADQDKLPRRILLRSVVEDRQYDQQDLGFLEVMFLLSYDLKSDNLRSNDPAWAVSFQSPLSGIISQLSPSAAIGSPDSDLFNRHPADWLYKMVTSPARHAGPGTWVVPDLGEFVNSSDGIYIGQFHGDFEFVPGSPTAENPAQRTSDQYAVPFKIFEVLKGDPKLKDSTQKILVTASEFSALATIGIRTGPWAAWATQRIVFVRKAPGAANGPFVMRTPDRPEFSVWPDGLVHFLKDEVPASEEEKLAGKTIADMLPLPGLPPHLRVFDAIASQDGQHLGSYATLVKKILETFKNGYDSSRDFPQLQAILTSHAASLPTPQFIIELWNADAHDYYNKDTGSMVGVGDFVNEGLWKPGDDGVHIGIPPEGLLRVSVLYGPNENYKLYMENGKIGSTANWKDLHPENQKVIESAEGNNKGDNGWYTKPGPQAGYVWHYAYFQISPTADGHPNGFSFDSIPP